ncbi:MAG: family 16 glycosylhydrolase [Pseudomonadota bacterium]|uniref:family 16 glycosylhydrolase n=1 Tax=Phenylobacterium sp. TaxID=1871053 RepID=UPI0025DE6C29|nr:family 16 glycosylhydrolase [Phenylobacterium sp.]
MILVVNLDRQPQRLRRTLRELRRFRTSDGASLAGLARRLAAIDARDGRAVAATADVDQSYRIADQLYVQPDARLEACFGADEPVRMTRQEVAVAQSHVEAWKVIAAGSCDHVLVIEDDVWFRAGAASAIDRGWRAAARRYAGAAGPRLLYFSYEDAGGTASRADECEALFRPERGLWFLSGYVLSRDGADLLLRAMPVIGPVDMWINYRFEELGALALTSPAILQRPDGGSDNAYSVLPFLARAGIVDADTIHEPPQVVGPVVAWTARSDREGLAMALSMLGLRVRAFDRGDREISASELSALLTTFDALLDPPLGPCALAAAIEEVGAKFIFEAEAHRGGASEHALSMPSSTVILPPGEPDDALWGPICALLDLSPPIHAFPKGAPRAWRLFRDDRPAMPTAACDARWGSAMDDSPWALLPVSDRPSPPRSDQADRPTGDRLLHATMTTPSALFPGRAETFPGNLATFAREGLLYNEAGARLVLDKFAIGDRPYRSGAFASARAFNHGRFEAEIKAARGSGLVTGFFLHRSAPRQEIDIELTGDDPRSMLVNVYFNPGDDGATLGFGYRGSPCRIELGFDATAEFHHYAIDWRPGRISWAVDGKIVHERMGWEPTPIPHLSMRLHANLWAPRSEELSGRIDERALPLSSGFRNVSVWT